MPAIMHTPASKLPGISDALSSADRMGLLRDRVGQDDLDGIIVTNVSDLRWLTGFEGVFDGERAHMALVTREACDIHTDSRYSNALRERAQGTSWEVFDEREAHSKWLAKRVVEVFPGRTSTPAAGADAPEQLKIAIEDDTPLCEWRALAAELDGMGVELCETCDIVRTLRSVKDAGEVECLMRAQEITDAAFSHMLEWLRVGVTERQAAFELDMFLRQNGDGLAFPTICAAGKNSANPHHVPSDAVIAKGDLVIFDFGGRWRDYDADMTRTVAFGEPGEREREIYETVRKANEACEDFVAPGKAGKEVHALAERIIAEAGFEGRFGHALGHGVGIDIHELPNQGKSSENLLCAGSVVTVEPGIYVPGLCGVRIEDFGVVADDGFHVFTKAPHDMPIL